MLQWTLIKGPELKEAKNIPRRQIDKGQSMKYFEKHPIGIQVLLCMYGEAMESIKQ